MAPMRFHSASSEAERSPTSAAGAAAVASSGLLSAGRQSIDGRLEPLLAEDVLRQAKGHADAGAGEAEVPVDALREIAGDQRADEGAEVDAHVEDREARIAAAVALRDRATRRACSRSA